MGENYRQQSKLEWYRKSGQPNIEDLKFGCLQRIADACEVIAEDNLRLKKELNYLKGENVRLEKLNYRYWRAICAYKGIIKKRKN